MGEEVINALQTGFDWLGRGIGEIKPFAGCILSFTCSGRGSTLTDFPCKLGALTVWVM